ncbi:MAG: Urease accessory protein UreD [Candidatus Eremiobacteraeota bacterium]|nr:Urease accessory protein UreD [Candidatus Eremiobacteraeota bacterium]
MIANSLAIEAHERDGRTILTRMRADGLWRTSRPFRDGEAARVVVSQLGPGMVRGDAFAVSGRVTRGAHLIVGAQMATRVLSGPEAATSVAEWTLEAGSFLELLAEPTLVADGAAYAARLTLRLEPGARAHVVELVRRERGAALRVVTVATRAGRLALVDALRFDAGDDDDAAIGTLVILGAVDVAAVDRAADRCAGVRAGIGVTRDGDVLVRVIGPEVWPVQAALAAIRTAAVP